MSIDRQVRFLITMHVSSLAKGEASGVFVYNPLTGIASVEKLDDVKPIPGLAVSLWVCGGASRKEIEEQTIDILEAISSLYYN